MNRYINLPGIGNSGQNHWHTIWENESDQFSRFRPNSWEEPILHDWVHALEQSVEAIKKPILIAHSLACLLVVHWAAVSTQEIAGAVLVATPDPSSPVFPEQAATFQNVPITALSFPTLMITSSNDPYGAIGYSEMRAKQWEASLINIGTQGHINENSELGHWQEGLNLIKAFSAGLVS